MTDVTKLQRMSKWHKESKMGKLCAGAKNRNRRNGVVNPNGKKGSNRDQWQKEYSGADRRG